MDTKHNNTSTTIPFCDKDRQNTDAVKDCLNKLKGMERNLLSPVQLPEEWNRLIGRHYDDKNIKYDLWFPDESLILLYRLYFYFYDRLIKTVILYGTSHSQEKINECVEITRGLGESFIKTNPISLPDGWNNLALLGRYYKDERKELNFVFFEIDSLRLLSQLYHYYK